MKHVVLAFLVTLGAISASADDELGGLVGLPRSSDNRVWVEVSIPVAKNGGFADRIDEQRTGSVGAEIGFGWRPFFRSMERGDPAVIQALKRIGVSLDAAWLKGAKFDQYLYTSSGVVPVSDRYECYSADGYWNNRCFYCSSYSGYCREQYTDVFGRDSYVKYSNGSVAFGSYVPVEIAGKLVVEGGANLRFHFTSEGVQTDALRYGVETSLGATIKVAYPVGKRVSIGVKAEKSIVGFRYKSVAATVTLKL